MTFCRRLKSMIQITAFRNAFGFESFEYTLPSRRDWCFISEKDVPVDLNENFVLSYPTCQKKSESDRKTILVLCLAIGLPNLLFVVGVGYIAYIACCRDNNSYGRR
ncbi:uncharacterized protein LOC113339243 [Papaver somniferum]|uniref:uncharacterized protein LOC113339243 n=1 Tax=Papaver somniferum TaxID=3469 RepID=UPI000E700F90|nr:uncharacterized protein LOC113339243 [Papaver somniferum]